VRDSGLAGRDTGGVQHQGISSWALTVKLVFIGLDVKGSSSQRAFILQQKLHWFAEGHGVRCSIHVT